MMNDGIEAFGYRVSVDKQAVKVVALVAAATAAFIAIPTVVGWAILGGDSSPFIAWQVEYWLTGFLVIALVSIAFHTVHQFLDAILVVEEVDDE